MKNYSLLPVCKRTRYKEAEMFKECYKEIKRRKEQEMKKNEHGSCSGSDMGNGGSSSGNSGRKNMGGVDTIILDDSEDDVVFEEEREEGEGDVEGREFIIIGEDEGCDVDKDRYNVGDLKVKKEEVRCGSNDDDDEEDSSDDEDDEGGVGASTRTKPHFGLQGEVENEDGSNDDDEEEEGDSSDDDDDNDEDVVIDSSEVDSDESETSSSSEDADLMNWEDGGAQKTTKSVVIEDRSVKDQQEDKEAEIEIIQSVSEDVDDDFVKGPVKRVHCVGKRTISRVSVEAGKKRLKHETSGEEDVILITSDGSDGEDEVIRSSGVKTGFEERNENDQETGSTSSGVKTGFEERNENNQKTGSTSSGLKTGFEERNENNQKTGSNCVKSKRGRRSLECDEVEKILAASILDKEEGNLPYEEIPELSLEPKLPLKFSFGEEESPPPEKSEEEKEIERLWNEMALAFAQNDVNGSEAVQNGPDASDEVDTATLCTQGSHYFILDEEIGIKCKYCSYVDVEIRYYVPPMSKHSWGRSERRDSVRMQHDDCDKVQFQDLEFDSQAGSDQSPDLNGTVWDIIPSVRRGMHPHQVDGFEFLWKNIAGGIHLGDLKGPTSCNGGSGCVISHAPGTGKTRLTIAFLQTYVKLYPRCKPVIIAPLSMLDAWEGEFQKWRVEVPFHNLNSRKLTGNEHKAALKLLKPGNISLNSIRMIKLYSWQENPGVLVLSYNLFEKLVGGDKKKNESRNMIEHESVWNRGLLELPGLLVLDEGHTPRNSNSRIWKALSQMQTGRKIILSGTPFQNNFDELFNILCLVRTEFADKISSQCYKARRSHKSEAREYWTSLTSDIGKSADDGLKSDRLDQVRKMIAPFVHVHKGSILQERLPGLRDSVVILEPVGIQKMLLDNIKESMNRHNFDFEHAVSVVCVHPHLLLLKSCNTAGLNFDRSQLGSLELDPEAGVKTKFLMELVQLADLVGEKVLVFSQFIDPLKLISKQIKEKLDWIEGREILFMHGKCDQDQRQASLKDFNDPNSSSKLMLASTKACSEGINLVGASRVVLLDVVWNPSVERQAISRAYRLGQEKVVHIYHLLASGTMEEDKYRRQAIKDRLSELVFYSADDSDGAEKISSMLSDDKKDHILEQMVQGDKLKHIFKKIIFQPKECNLVETFN